MSLSIDVAFVYMFFFSFQNLLFTWPVGCESYSKKKKFTTLAFNQAILSMSY